MRLVHGSGAPGGALSLDLKEQRRGFDLNGSGTIRAVGRVLKAAGWTEGAITLEGVRRLRRSMIEQGHARRLSFEGMQLDRAPVFPGGVAILKAVLQLLEVERMEPASAALREGLLYDLVGRIHHEDVRDRTIASLSRRYDVDIDHARRVERTALTLFDQVGSHWKLDLDEGRRFLSWAARLHEIGLAIAFSGYHKHGAYILSNANLAGFSREDCTLVATLVRCQRRTLHRELFAMLPPYHRELGLRVCLCLRLAVRLNRGHRASDLPPIEFGAKGDTLSLGFPPDWLDAHPLTRADLADEAIVLARSDFQLEAS